MDAAHTLHTVGCMPDRCSPRIDRSNDYPLTYGGTHLPTVQLPLTTGNLQLHADAPRVGYPQTQVHVTKSAKRRHVHVQLNKRLKDSSKWAKGKDTPADKLRKKKLKSPRLVPRRHSYRVALALNTKACHALQLP